MSNRVSRMIRLTLSVCILAIVPAAAGAKTIYVDDDVSGLNDGTSWANAYKCLQDALADANDAPKPVEVRVARGTYKPDQGAKQKAGNREATFQLINGVTLKGGYAGLGQPDPNARDIESYETILSGDLNGDDAEVALLEHLLTEPTRAENSYHVVTASGTDGSAVLDGFTVMNGNANIWSGFGDGAGMYVGSGSPTVANCTFTTNSAHFGGGMYSGLTSNPTLTNCAFHGNSAGRYGGGMDNWHGSPTLTNCIFSSNWAFEQGGGIHTYESSPLLTNCKFIANLAGDGGGVYSWHSSPTVIDCTFIENRAGIGGGIYATISSPTLTNCTFTANEAFYSGGGLSSGGESLSATKCTFMANKAGTNGGGLSQGSRSSTLTHCRFIANAANGSGGGMSTSARSLTVANCMFGGNSAEMGGGVYSTINVFIRDNERILNNCTFAGNSAQDGNALASHNIEAVLSLGNLKLTNCIVWDGANEIWNHDGSKIMISYGDVQGGQASIYDPRGVVIWGDGNMDADPLFANPGRWADANDPNVVLGPRDPNAVWVDGDYHLKSQAGRWDPASQSWVKDDVTSPCIDAGDPNSPVGDESEPNGGRINMGAYGGTKEASMSPIAEPIVYIQWLGHSSVKLWAEDCIVYVDPQSLSIAPHDATLVLVTHSHGDHYSPSDIARVANAQTQFVAPPDVVQLYGKGQAVVPGQTIDSYCARLIGVPAYNTNKTNHPKSRNWVGYVIELGGKCIYVAGDTDLTDEMKSLGDIDVAVLPAGGTYTMTAVEAAQATQYIKPDLAIPYHWGRVVGTLADAQTFAQLAMCAVKILTVGETISSDNWPVYSPLVAHWKLDETAGNIADDSVSNYDGTLYGGPAWVPSGKIDGALQLDGVDDYIVTPFVSNPNKGPFSVYAWVKGGPAGAVIVSQKDIPGTGATWLGADPVQGRLMTGLVPPAAGRTLPQPLMSGFAVTDGQWHHVGLVWDGSQRHLYADGAEVAKDTSGLAALQSCDGGLHLGAGKGLGAGTSWAGLLDDIRIYNVALTPAELEQLAR